MRKRGLILEQRSFNPCYAGSKIESSAKVSNVRADECFNPCYAGSKIESHSF
mgnify:CR=1 FL=1